MRFIWPWNKMFIYNIRLQQTTHTYDVLANDGLEMQAEVAITWKPIEADLGRLHRDIGPDYVDVLLVPIVGACAREEIARHPPDALYSAQRLTIQEAIRNEVKKTMLSRFYPRVRRESYLIVEDVLIKEIRLPAEVRKAIEDKVAQKHIAEAYAYRLLRERKEADRKAIEAEGIRRFQETINSTISDGYLKWKGIDATLELAKSPNAKVVVIGAGGSGDGMPLILGNFENTPGAGTSASAAPAVSTAPAAPPVSTTTFGPPPPP
jgi:regulator of protease activity HflC (stomatin/prohibitin superfamily)